MNLTRRLGELGAKGLADIYLNLQEQGECQQSLLPSELSIYFQQRNIGLDYLYHSSEIGMQ
jgi:hypothetical protein